MAVTKNHLKSVLGKFRATQTKLDDKKYVAQIDGKTLSANDFTDELKQKLDEIEDAAQVNVIEKIKVNGVELDNVKKTVNIELPYVNRLSDGVYFFDGDGKLNFKIPVL